MTIKYKDHYTNEVKKDLKSIKIDFGLLERLHDKIDEILEAPHHYKPLRNIFKNCRRTHVGSFVIIFKVKESEKVVSFLRFKHHDKVYNK